MKYTFLTLLCSLLCFAPLSATSRAADNPDHILILFDLSHSMTRKLQNMTQIEAARRVFSEVMQDIPASTVLGLRLFAHEGNRDKDMACQESELVVPLQSGGREQISQIVAHRDPVGQKTPLGRALSLAMDDLQGIQGSRKIILLSDGLETCDGEPEEVAQQLFDMGVPVDAIGIGDEGVVQLGGIALAGGGKFFLGSNFDSLRQALATALGAGRNVVPSATQDPPQLSELPLNVPESGAALASAALVRVIPLPPDEETPPHQAEEEAEAEAESEQPAEPVLNLEIILDSSGSMLQRLEGRTKIAIAKQALQETAEALESELIGLAFRAYGFDKSLEKTKEASCPNTELLVNFGSEQADQHIDQIVATAQRLTAYGYTPIADSLRLAGSDLAPYKDQRPTILLISDGEETCGGDGCRHRSLTCGGHRRAGTRHWL